MKSVERVGTVTFTDNEIFYGQDFRIWRGIPPGIAFEVTDSGTQWRLQAPGYGGTPYGNGALYVAKTRLSEGELFPGVDHVMSFASFGI